MPFFVRSYYALFISPRILKESWRAIIIVNVVRHSSFVRSFVVVRLCSSLFDVTLFLCPPMISLNGWRYEILIRTKKFRLDVEMCNRRKKIRKKSFFRPLGRFSYHLVYVVDCAGFLLPYYPRLHAIIVQQLHIYFFYIRIWLLQAMRASYLNVYLFKLFIILLSGLFTFTSSSQTLFCFNFIC